VAGVGGGDLNLEEVLEEGRMAEILGGGALELGGQRLGGGSQPQVGQVAAGLLVDRGAAHAVPSTRSA
jgi:hypothetical protein